MTITHFSGLLYSSNKSLKDKVNGCSLLDRAAKLGNVEAQKALETLDPNLISNLPKITSGLAWLDKKAQDGNVHATYILNFMSSIDAKTKEDFNDKVDSSNYFKIFSKYKGLFKSISWLISCAEQGDGEAINIVDYFCAQMHLNLTTLKKTLKAMKFIGLA